MRRPQRGLREKLFEFACWRKVEFVLCAERAGGGAVSIVTVPIAESAGSGGSGSVFVLVAPVDAALLVCLYPVARMFIVFTVLVVFAHCILLSILVSCSLFWSVLIFFDSFCNHVLSFLFHSVIVYFLIRFVFVFAPNAGRGRAKRLEEEAVRLRQRGQDVLPL